MSKELQGKKVKHKSTGWVGVIQTHITSAAGDSVIIFFPEPNREYEFSYPSAFEKNIRFLNAEIQKETLQQLEKNKQSPSVNIRTGTAEKTKESLVLSDESISDKNANPTLANYNDLKRIVLNGFNDLRKLEKSGCVPCPKPDFLERYDGEWDQACYVARYSYAYTYEYLQMSIDMLKMHLPQGRLKVFSLGCGIMTDAWALKEAISLAAKDIVIDYTGVDIVQWKTDYKPEFITDSFRKEKAGDFLSNCKDLQFDFLLFPKSLGDIYRSDKSDFNRIRRTLAYSDLKETFLIAISLPEYEKKERKKQDKEAVDILTQQLLRKGYVLADKKKNTPCGEYVSNSSPAFPRFNSMLSTSIEELTGKKPMTSRKYENYEILKFTKAEIK